MAYITEGIIKTVEVDASGVTFTLQPTSPYSFEQSCETGMKRHSLFVSDADSSSFRSAIIAPNDVKFVFAFGDKQPGNLGSFFVWMQNRQMVSVTCEKVKAIIVVSKIFVNQ